VQNRWKRVLFLVLIVAVSAIVYQSKIRRQMGDFAVYRTAAIRARAADLCIVPRMGIFNLNICLHSPSRWSIRGDQ
jgi:hypothetical protein